MTFEICIAGKNKIAVSAASFLVDQFPSALVSVLPNRTDSGRDTWQPSLRKWAIDQDVAITSLKSCYDKPDLLFLSLEFDRIIKPQKFATERLFNIHFSKLPKFKGMYTSVHPILAGEKSSGVTLHRIDAGIDTGEMIDQIEFPIPISMTARELYDQYLEHGYQLFKRNIQGLIERKEVSKQQESIDSSYFSTSSIQFSNLSPDFRQTAFQFHNWIRGFTFREYQLPIVFGDAICKSQIADTKSNSLPGTIVSESDYLLTVSTIDFDVKLWKDLPSLFHRCLADGKKESALAVLNSMEDIEKTTVEGWTPLMVAAYHADAHFVSQLLNDGANYNSTNRNGTTVLMYAYSGAAKTGRLDALKLICECSPDFDAIDHSQKNVFSYAEENGDDAINEFIKQTMRQL